MSWHHSHLGVVDSGRHKRRKNEINDHHMTKAGKCVSFKPVGEGESHAVTHRRLQWLPSLWPIKRSFQFSECEAEAFPGSFSFLMGWQRGNRTSQRESWELWSKNIYDNKWNLFKKKFGLIFMLLLFHLLHFTQCLVQVTTAQNLIWFCFLLFDISLTCSYIISNSSSLQM